MSRQSVGLSVPLSDSILFARRRHARVAVTNAFDRGQHDRLCPHPNAISGGVYRFATRYLVEKRFISLSCIMRSAGTLCCSTANGQTQAPFEMAPSGGEIIWPHLSTACRRCRCVVLCWCIQHVELRTTALARPTPDGLLSRSKQDQSFSDMLHLSKKQ